MTADRLAALQGGHAFDPAPRKQELHELHVPFDDLNGGRTCEAALRRALRQGHRVALVGVSGSGKTSVTEHVLGPLVEDLAPLPVPVSVEAPEVATEPGAFATHIVGLIRRWVADSMPQQASRASEIVPQSVPKRSRVSAAPEWMGVKLELAYELSQAAALQSTSTAEVLEQARQLLDLIVSDGLMPVLVLDDTDRWLATSWQPDSPTLRSAFFGRVIRVLAEDLATAAVVAVHPIYQSDADYQAAAGFINTTIHVPALPGAAAVGRVLARRASLALGEPEESVLGGLVSAGAVDVLYQHYAAELPDLRRHVLQIAHLALTLAVDVGADELGPQHIRSALTEVAALTG